jgi:hypothetical protein
MRESAFSVDSDTEGCENVMRMRHFVKYAHNVNRLRGNEQL